MERSFSAQMPVLYSMNVFSGDKIMDTVSPHLRAAVFLSTELAARRTAMNALTDSAKGVLSRSHTERWGTIISELTVIRRNMEALSIEPELSLLQEISNILTSTSSSDSKLVPSSATMTDGENVSSVRIKRDILATVPDSRKKRKVVDGAEVQAILEARKTMSIAWIHSVSIDNPVRSIAQQHVSLCPLSVDTSVFLEPMGNAFGLPLVTANSSVGDLSGPNISSIISRITCDMSTVISDRLSCTRRKTAPMTAVSSLPPSSNFILGENGDFYAGEDDSKWLQVRANVRALLENIFIAAFVEYKPPISDEYSTTWASAALARGTVLAAEVEEEICSFLCCHRYLIA